MVVLRGKKGAKLVSFASRLETKHVFFEGNERSTALCQNGPRNPWLLNSSARVSVSLLDSWGG
jgi:hypothetical protein